MHPAHSRQRECSVKTLHSPLSTVYRRHCVLSGGTQHRALPPERRNRNINLNKYFTSSNGVRTHNRRVTVTPLCLWATTATMHSITAFIFFTKHTLYTYCIKTSSNSYNIHTHAHTIYFHHSRRISGGYLRYHNMCLIGRGWQRCVVI